LLEVRPLLLQGSLGPVDGGGEGSPADQHEEEQHAAPGEEEQAPLARGRRRKPGLRVGPERAEAIEQAAHHAPPGVSPEQVNGKSREQFALFPSRDFSVRGCLISPKHLSLRSAETISSTFPKLSAVPF